MKIFEPAAQIIEHALIEYEEHPDKFIPNSNSIIEDTINNIPPELMKPSNTLFQMIMEKIWNMT